MTHEPAHPAPCPKRPPTSGPARVAPSNAELDALDLALATIDQPLGSPIHPAALRAIDHETIERLRSDRAALQTLGRLDGQHLESDPAISAAVRAQHAAHTTLAHRSRVRPRVALGAAASLALAGGLAAIVALGPAVLPPSPSSAHAGRATKPPATPELASAPTREPALASARNSSDRPETLSADNSVSPSPAGPIDAPSASLASAEAIAPPGAPQTGDHAWTDAQLEALAAQGRLALCVFSVDPDAPRRSLDALIESHRPGLQIAAVADTDPARIAELVRTLALDLEPLSPGARPTQALAARSAPIGASLSHNTPAADSTLEHALVASLPADARSLRALANELTLGELCSVRWLELEEAGAPTIPAGTTAQDLLWWTQGPSARAPRAAVRIIPAHRAPPAR